jgi:signal transduction histidine kinase
MVENIPIEDPINRQMAALLQVVLLGLIILVIIATFINLFLATDPYEILVQSLQIGIIFAIPMILLRRGYFRISVYYLIAPFLILVTAGLLASNLRNEAETLTFFTLAILLAGLLVGRTALFITFTLSAAVVLFFTFNEQDPAVRLDYIAIAGNFILLNGLLALFIDRFRIALREALAAALEREQQLTNEIQIRRQAEKTIEEIIERLEILHEIDRALLSAQSLHDIARAALMRIRKLIPCERASITLFDFQTNEASFLTADFDGIESIPDTPIRMEEYGLDVIKKLKENQPWSTDDILSESEVTELDKHLAIEHGIHVWLSLPLLYQGQLIGALNLGRVTGKPFHQKDAEIVHDVANQLAIALQQTNLYNALQNELGERQKLISELEQRNDELTRFTYTVSHDLRNPLVTIRGFLGMLKKDLHDHRMDKVQSDFQRIAGATDKMDELLSDLLELSRVGRIINPPEEVHLARLVQDAIDTVEARLRSKNVTVHVSPSLSTIHGDRIRLREVFENLIDNAVKYMGDQRNPVIEIGSNDREGERVIFVRDNGIGIEARYHAKIFHLFEKLDSTVEGTGIGLALVKRIVETHGGKIWVESEGLGKGSTFCFTIPDNTSN